MPTRVRHRGSSTRLPAHHRRPRTASKRPSGAQLSRKRGKFFRSTQVDPMCPLLTTLSLMPATGPDSDIQPIATSTRPTSPTSHPCPGSAPHTAVSDLPVYISSLLAHRTGTPSNPNGHVTAELPLLFGTHFEYRGNSTEFEWETSYGMEALWLSFASNSSADPNDGVSVTWPKYSEDTDSLAVFAANDTWVQFSDPGGVWVCADEDVDRGDGDHVVVFHLGAIGGELGR